MRNCVSNKISIHDVVSGLKGEKDRKGNALKTENYFKEKIKLKKICALRQIQDKTILLDTDLFFENDCVQ